MQRLRLEAKKRTILGKKVKQLRQKGFLPTTLYGKKVKSESLQVDLVDFSKVFKKAKETGLVDLIVETKEPRPVLIHNVQRHPVTGLVLHADFYQVDLKEKVKSAVPVVTSGEAKAVTENKGVLLHVLSEVEVEALPADLPENITVDITGLDQVDQSVLVKDLIVDRSKITILTNEEEIVFKIGPLITKEMEEQIKAEEEAKAAAVQTEPGVASSTETTEPVLEKNTSEETAKNPSEK